MLVNRVLIYLNKPSTHYISLHFGLPLRFSLNIFHSLILPFPKKHFPVFSGRLEQLCEQPSAAAEKQTKQMKLWSVLLL